MAASAAGIGPSVPTICDGDVGDRRGSVGPLGERGAVAGEQRRARRERHVPASRSLRLQPGEQQAPVKCTVALEPLPVNGTSSVS